MTSTQAFLAAILASPKDDAPRQMYADWLQGAADENCRKFGEFIQVQLQIACSTDIEVARRGLFPIEMALLDDGLENIPHRGHCPLIGGYCGASREFAQWMIPAGAAQGVLECGEDFALYYRRGFVTEVSCTEEGWIRHGPTIVHSQPVQKVLLTDKDPEGDLIGSSPAWHRRSIVNQADDIHCSIWDNLQHGRLDLDGYERWRWYKTADRANRDLSRACLRWARKVC